MFLDSIETIGEIYPDCLFKTVLPLQYKKNEVRAEGRGCLGVFWILTLISEKKKFRLLFSIFVDDSNLDDDELIRHIVEVFFFLMNHFSLFNGHKFLTTKKFYYHYFYFLSLLFERNSNIEIFKNYYSNFH